MLSVGDSSPRSRHTFRPWIRDPGGKTIPVTKACMVIIAGTLAYGFVLGFWRCPLQGLYSGLKMPLLFFAVVLASTLLNAMLAQLFGAALSLRKVLALVLAGMAAASLILASLVPVGIYFTLQAPPPPAGLVGLPLDHPRVAPAMHTFRILLLLHVGIIGIAGILGNLRIYQHLAAMLPSRTLAAKVLAAWILVTGFVGCELSWLFSPFLCKPNFPAHILARTYFDGNFYEHVFRALREMW